MSLIQLLLRSMVASVRLLKISTVLVPVDVKITGHLSQITESV